MLRRKIDAILEKWRTTPGHKPLLIKGLRQIGKTSSVVEFAKTHYQNAFLLDFRQQRNLAAYFEGDFDVDSLSFLISSLGNSARIVPGSKLVPGKTLFIFDEIQDCPNARSSLKYFALDGKYDVIGTGSLLGIAGYHVGKPYPRGIGVGYESQIQMHPMDFEEFLWAMGYEQSPLEFAYECFKKSEPIPLPVHNRLLELTRLYICVGGMPSVVTTYLETRDLAQVEAKQKQLTDGFQSDFGVHLSDDKGSFYDETEKSRVLATFQSIPRQLGKDNKKFQYSKINHNARAYRYKGAIDWLENYGLIKVAHNVSSLEYPLRFFEIEDEFKVYLSDIGLLTSLFPGAAPEVLAGGLSIAKGAIYENLVADQISKADGELHYFDKNGTLEVDFLKEFGSSPYLIEVKARDGNAKSAKTILADPRYHVDGLIKLSAQNVSRQVKNGKTIITAPYYLASYILG